MEKTWEAELLALESYTVMRCSTQGATEVNAPPQSSESDGCRRKLSVSHQFVEFRASEARHLTCFVNRTSKLLGEWNRLRPHGFRNGWNKLRLFYFVVLSSLAPHGFSYLN